MASRKSAERDSRLAAALRQNLKRRKTGSQGADAEAGSPAVPGGLGAAAEGGPNEPARPKTASKRN